MKSRIVTIQCHPLLTVTTISSSLSPSSLFFCLPPGRRILLGSRTSGHAAHDLSLIQTSMLTSRLSLEGLPWVHAGKRNCQVAFVGFLELKASAEGIKPLAFAWKLETNGHVFLQERRTIALGHCVVFCD